MITSFYTNQMQTCFALPIFSNDFCIHCACFSILNSKYFVLLNWNLINSGVEAEAGSGKRVPLPLWPFISNVKNLNVVQFFVKYTTKSECFINRHLQTKRF